MQTECTVVGTGGYGVVFPQHTRIIIKAKFIGNYNKIPKNHVYNSLMLYKQTPTITTE